MLPKLRPLLVGSATFIPGVPRLLGAAKESLGLGGATSARYCYSAWLRHAVLLARSGLWRQPRVVAELGPGDSLGIGLSALLTGAEIYRAFDVLRLADTERNLMVFDELLALFRAAAPVPDDAEFPEMTPRISDYAFPHYLWPAGQLAAALAPARVAQLRAALARPTELGPIAYAPDWDRTGATPGVEVDLVLSQAVLEHVDDLPGTYRALARWVRPGGAMSHAIDFRCHNMVRQWNGHWAIPDAVWHLVRGRRRYLLNREPCSMHLALLAESGFVAVQVDRYRLQNTLSIGDLATRFRRMDPEDLVTGMATIQSRRERS